MNNLMKKIILLNLLIGLLIALPLSAKVGVGVGLGKIEVDEPLSPGGIYKLPAISVLNSGDESGEYEMEVTFQEDQPEKRPGASWFSFSPERFPLDAGQSQTVNIALTLPTSVTPGDYFAYLEAHPVKKAAEGGTTIGIAAATKTYFTVKAGSVLGAFTERVRSFFTTNSPGSFIILGVIVLIVLFITFKKYFALRFKIERKKKS